MSRINVNDLFDLATRALADGPMYKTDLSARMRALTDDDAIKAGTDEQLLHRIYVEANSSKADKRVTYLGKRIYALPGTPDTDPTPFRPARVTTTTQKPTVVPKAANARPLPAPIPPAPVMSGEVDQTTVSLVPAHLDGPRARRRSPSPAPSP